MRRALASLHRYIAGTRHGTRLHFCWCEPWTMASDATNAFAFEGDYCMGVLLSRSHGEWAWAQSGTIRTDIRYTLTTAFEAFPWPPAPTDDQRDEVARRGREIVEYQQSVSSEREIGLTALYNDLDEGAYADLRELHDKLDVAVAVAYGWPPSAASDADESNRRLLELNRRIAAGEAVYAPF